MPRNNILLEVLPAPKRVQLPNGRVCFAKCQKVVRERLPERVRIRRTYARRIGPRRKRIRRIGPTNQRRKRQQILIYQLVKDLIKNMSKGVSNFEIEKNV